MEFSEGWKTGVHFVYTHYVDTSDMSLVFRSRQEDTFILLSSCMCLLKPLEPYVAQNKNTVGFIVLGILNHLLLLAGVLQQAVKRSVLARGFRYPP